MKRLLVVVDYQHDLVDGTLGFPAAEIIDKRIAAKIDEYHENGDFVVYTMASHTARYLETLMGRSLPVPHCVESTGGWDLYGATADAKLDRDRMFRSATIGSAKLFEYLSGAQTAAMQAGLDAPFISIEIVGLMGNSNVVADAFIAQAACPDVPIVVDAACIASPDGELNEKALDILESAQIRVVNRLN